MFSFLVGRHFGLVGVEAFVEGLGLPLTWSMAVQDVLLLLFSMFFIANQIFTDILMHCLLFFALVMRCLSTFYALFLHFLCTCSALFMHFLCTFYAFFMRFLCALQKHIKSVYTLSNKRMHLLCTFYALFMRIKSA